MAEEDASVASGLKPMSHHIRGQVCRTRPPYRRGKRETAVKVYTINDESQYLIIHGVPALKLHDELRARCQEFGPIERLELASHYPSREAFTEVYLLKYRKFASALYAKKALDDSTLLGGTLHVCYAPELETLEETRNKLSQRRRFFEARSEGYEKRTPKKRKVVPVDDPEAGPSGAPYIWAGRECHSNADSLSNNTFSEFVKRTSDSNNSRLDTNITDGVDKKDPYEDVRLSIKRKLAFLSEPTPKIRWRIRPNSGLTLSSTSTLSDK